MRNSNSNIRIQKSISNYMDTGLFVFIIHRRNSCFVFEGLTFILWQFTVIYTKAVGLLHKGRLLEFLGQCELK
jgi:hypothetical protein